MPSTHVYVVRHGETDWNVEDRAQGHTDNPLNETGMQQAMAIGLAFQAWPITKIISSDLIRCVQTAEPIAAATGAEIEKTTALREPNLGEYEGMPGKQFWQSVAEIMQTNGVGIFDARPPLGESFRDAWNRVESVSKSLLEMRGESVVVVTHGGTAGILLAQLLHGTIETSVGFGVRNASITDLKLRAEGQYQLLTYDDVSHLS